MPAQPFRETQSGGKGKETASARCPKQPRQKEAETRKNREHGRKPGHTQRQGPGEFVSVDEKRGAEPPKTGDKIAKAPPPANRERPPCRNRQAKTKPPA